MSKEKLDIYQKQQILFDLLNKFGERGFDLFDKACAVIANGSEPENTSSEVVNPDNRDEC